MIKYRVSRYQWRNEDPIQVVEIDRETDKFIWIKGRQTAKTATGEWYRDTPEEAKQCLVDHRIEEALELERRIDSMKGSLYRAREKIKEAEALPLPEPEQERKR